MPPVRILLVEDQEDSLTSLARLLRMSGYFVHTARNMTEALQVAAEERFDLLLSDHGLPDGSGLDLSP